MRARIAGLAVLAAVAAAITGVAAPASASMPLVWHLAYVPHITDGVMVGVAAPANDAVWAIGRVYRKHGLGPDFVLHWNGKHWRKSGMPVPGYRADVVMSSSARNVWMFGRTAAGSPLAARWNGRRWIRIGEPSIARFGLQAEAVISPTDVWVAVGGYASRWNGSRWTLVPLPANFTLQQLGGSSPGNVWLAGINVSNRKLTAYRYRSGRWHLLLTPRPAATFVRLLVQSASSVWITATTSKSQWALHWTGGRWHHLGGASGYAPVPLAGYDRNGLWLDPGTLWTGRSWVAVAYSGTLGQLLPAGMAAAPGSTHAWLVGNARMGAVVLRV